MLKNLLLLITAILLISCGGEKEPKHLKKLRKKIVAIKAIDSVNILDGNELKLTCYVKEIENSVFLENTKSLIGMAVLENYQSNTLSSNSIIKISIVDENNKTDHSSLKFRQLFRAKEYYQKALSHLEQIKSQIKGNEKLDTLYKQDNFVAMMQKQPFVNSMVSGVRKVKKSEDKNEEYYTATLTFFDKDTVSYNYEILYNDQEKIESVLLK
ncbi:hypothetical protein [Aureivirga sp. CE67]|uniref:hypothetical protein n=1 Tax=Aureivirga sp. CE67 TaxID=1788983 RepID=UPI0018CA04BD|nr:hypothetical protein [Aureivirga sp. CE67]